MANNELSTSKICGRCNSLKPHSHFSITRANKDGLSYRCKQCDSDRGRLSRTGQGSLVIDRPCGLMSPTDRIIDDFGYDWTWAFVIFAPVVGCPGYVVGSNGTVWNTKPPYVHLRYSNQLSFMIPSLTTKGYHRFSFVKNKMRLAHHVVLEAFRGLRTQGTECCHNNGVRTDNRLSNLRWDTRKSNTDDKIRHGTMPYGTKMPNAILTEDVVVEIHRMAASQDISYADIAKRFGITEIRVSSLVRGRQWKHIAAQFANKPARKQVFPNRKGQHHPRAKLTDDIVRTARKLGAEGVPIPDISTRLGISYCSAWDIIRGRSWKHVT